jgi:DNA invertase Pin-like site-specific DNA recombinase
MRIGYARVSTCSQDTKAQIDALKAAGCDHIYEEKMSGRIADRPEFLKALAFAREGDEIVVYALSRLARSMKQLLATTDDLQRRGIGLKSLTEAIDTTGGGATATLLMHIMASINHFEIDLVRERTKAALAARGPGQRGGRPKVMTEPKIAMAKALLTEGKLPVHEVAREVGVGVSTLYRALPQAKALAQAA